MKLTNVDIRILFFLHSNAKNTSTQITKAIYEELTIHEQRKRNSMVKYRLDALEAAGVVSSEGKYWSITDKVSIGQSKLIFSTGEEELSIKRGLSMLVVFDDNYEIIKLENGSSSN